jgi:hypothetical protein
MPSRRQTGILLGDSTRHPPGADVMDEPIACPQYGVPAQITEQFWLDSTAGPVEHVKTGCERGHRFTPTAESLHLQPSTTTAATQLAPA